MTIVSEGQVENYRTVGPTESDGLITDYVSFFFSKFHFLEFFHRLIFNINQE